MKDENYKRIRVHINELKVIAIWRSTKFGRIEIFFRDGVPQKIIKKERNIDLNKLPENEKDLTRIIDQL